MKKRNVQVEAQPEQADDTVFELPPSYVGHRPSVISLPPPLISREQVPEELLQRRQSVPIFQSQSTTVPPLPPTTPPPPTAPPPLVRPASAPGPHPYHHMSAADFNPSLLPNVSQRGNINRTTPLPSIPSYGEDLPVYSTQQSITADWGDAIYEQSMM